MGKEVRVNIDTILKWIDNENPNITLEYGLPTESVQYALIDSRRGYIEEGLLEWGIEIVEKEAREGRIGAFVTSRDDWSDPEIHEIFEVWGWKRD